MITKAAHVGNVRHTSLHCAPATFRASPFSSLTGWRAVTPLSAEEPRVTEPLKALARPCWPLNLTKSPLSLWLFKVITQEVWDAAQNTDHQQNYLQTVCCHVGFLHMTSDSLLQYHDNWRIQTVCQTSLTQDTAHCTLFWLLCHSHI